MSTEPQNTDPRDGEARDAESPGAESLGAESHTAVVEETVAESEASTVVVTASAEDDAAPAEAEMAEIAEIASDEAASAAAETALIPAPTEVIPAADSEAPTAVFAPATAPDAAAAFGAPAPAFAGPYGALTDSGFFPGAAPVDAPAPKGKRRAVFLTAWLGSALAVGALTGGGILAATGSSTVKVDLGAPAPSASPSSSAPPVPAGVRSDGTHYGPLTRFLLPMPDGYGPGPDEGLFGNDSAVTPDQLDAEVTELFGKLPTSDLTSAKGAMEAAHMTQGAVRTYLKTSSDIQFSVLALQLDPSLAAKSTSDFLHIIKASNEFRSGPAVPGHPEAQCVLPATAPGDKLDEMLCLDTVGDTFVIANAAGTVPMDQKSITALFGKQVDLLKNGPAQ